MRSRETPFGRIALPTTILIVASLLSACGDDDAGGTAGSTAPTATASTTTSAVPTSAPAVTTPSGKTPAATVEALVSALYAALNAKDDAAFRALSTDGAYHDFYYDYGFGPGMFPGGFLHAESALAHTRTTAIEVTGEPVVSGSAVAIPVRYTHPNEVDVGFDLLVLDRTAEGLLVAGGATFYAREGLEPFIDTGAVVWAQHLAWNEDDLEGVLAVMDEDATMWDQVTDPTTRHQGEALGAFVASSLWFEVAMPGDPMIVFSGPFAVAATRLITTSDSSEGITLFLVRDGKIVLQAFAQ